MGEEDDDVRFVGRGAELDRLAQLLAQASAGSPVVAVVSGPAGIGKTTLLRRFLQRHSPVQVSHVAGFPWERHRPAALVRRLAEAGAGPADGELPAGEDPGEWGEALARRWRAAAAREPLVVAVDDAQDADAVSAQAITSAVARLGGARVLLLLGRALPARSVPAGPGVPPTVPTAPTVPAVIAPGLAPPAAVADALDRLPAVAVPVRALRPEDVRLLAARTAGVDLPLTVARRLWAHTCGIPRHLLEILRDSPPARWSDWQTRLPAPSSVLAEIAVVLRCCAPATRALVEAAAVLGPAPVLADVAALAGVADPVGALDEAFTAGLLAPVAGHGLDALSFPGPYVRAAVYATLGPVRRRQLHLGAVAILTDETDRLRHRVEAAPLPDDELAAELLDLARRKADEGAWAVVAGVLIDASRISRSRADRESRLIEAVNALAGAGLLGQAVDALPDIEALPTSARRDAALAYVAVQRGRRTSAGAYLESAWRACREATEPGRGPERQTAALVCQLQVLHALGDCDGEGMVHWARQAVEYAEPGSPAAVESQAILGLGYGMCGEVDAAFASYRAAIAECPRGPQLQRARMGSGWLQLAQDDPETARRELEFAVSTVRQTGSNRISLWALGWLARARFVLGDWPGALDAVDQAEALLAATGLHLIRPLVHWTAAQIHALRGEVDDAERHLRLGAASEHDYAVMAIPALLARAHVAEAAADYPAVVRHLTPLATRSPRGGVDEPGFWPWPDLYATALVFTGRLDEAESFLCPLEELVARRRHRSESARLAVVRGRLLGARGDIAGAEQAFARARDHLAGLLLPYERARLDFAHGLTLRRAGRRRDAGALLETARQEFDALGAKVLVQRCERELKTGRQAARGLAEAGLTEQERTVSELVAKGMTNKEVAAEMMLSVKTVQFHLTRIYAKLGLRSRAELAASLRPAP